MSWSHGQEVKLTVRVSTLVHAECWNKLERDQTSKGGYAAMGGMGGGVSGVGLDCLCRFIEKVTNRYRTAKEELTPWSVGPSRNLA